MPNKNYINGRQKEYRLKKKEEEKGNICLRMSGSHGFADLISIDTVNRKITLIQSKPKSMSENKKQQIVDDNEFIVGNYDVDFIVI